MSYTPSSSDSDSEPSSTPLNPYYHAIAQGNLPKVRSLMPPGAQCATWKQRSCTWTVSSELNVVTFTPLTLALWHGHDDVAAYLIERGVDVRAPLVSEWGYSGSRKKCSALCLALLAGHTHLVQPLLDAVVRKRAWYHLRMRCYVETEDVEANGETVLQVAFRLGQVDVMEALLRVDPQLYDVDGTLMRECLECEEWESEDECDRCAALFLAAVEETGGALTSAADEAVRGGISAGRSGVALLQVAFFRGELQVGATTAARAIDSLAVEVVHSFLRSRATSLPLAAVIEANRLDIAPRLVQGGARLDDEAVQRAVVEQAGKRRVFEALRRPVPLLEAVMHGNCNRVREFLDAGASMECGGVPLLALAVELGQVVLVEQLLERGAEVDAVFDGRSALSRAFLRGDEAVARCLTGRGASANVEGVVPTPMAVAVRKKLYAMLDLLPMDTRVGGELVHVVRDCNEDLLHKLLQRDVDVNVVVDGTTALREAVRLGQGGMVTALLHHGARVGLPHPSDSALVAALAAKNVVMVLVLLSHSSQDDVGGTTVVGVMALDRDDRVAPLAKLLTLGAPGIANGVADAQPPLITAIEYDQVGLVEMLLQAGADPNAEEDNMTTLGTAVLRNNEHIVQLLLDNGANPNPAPPCPPPLWSVAGSAAWNHGNHVVVTQLLRAGADPSAVFDRQSVLSALHGMCFEGFTMLLLVAGADVNAPVQPSALSAACTRGDYGSALMLLRAGATDRPLAAAARSRAGGCAASEHLVALLLSYDADPSVDNALGEAIRAGNDESARCLIEAGAEVNPAVPRSPLMSACVRGRFTLVKALLQRGANVHHSCRGKTPLSEAVVSGKVKIVRTLLAYGADPRQLGSVAMVCAFRELGGRTLLATVKTLVKAGSSVLVRVRVRRGPETSVLQGVRAEVEALGTGHGVEKLVAQAGERERLVLLLVGVGGRGGENSLTRFAAHAMFDANVLGEVAELMGVTRVRRVIVRRAGGGCGGGEGGARPLKKRML